MYWNRRLFHYRCVIDINITCVFIYPTRELGIQFPHVRVNNAFVCVFFKFLFTSDVTKKKKKKTVKLDFFVNYIFAVEFLFSISILVISVLVYIGIGRYRYWFITLKTTRFSPLYTRSFIL